MSNIQEERERSGIFPEYRNETYTDTDTARQLLAFGEARTEIIHNVHFHDLMAKVGESLNDNAVDASLHQMTKVYHKGNLCPFHRNVVKKMAQRETIEVVIIGGSVTYGADLPDRLGQRWSNKFTQILQSGWYTGQINVNNIAVGACNIDVWIDKVNEARGADMVIIDLSVNDQGFDLQGLPFLYQNFLQLLDNLPKHPAMLIHYAFRTGKDNQAEFGHCPEPKDQVMKCLAMCVYSNASV